MSKSTRKKKIMKQVEAAGLKSSAREVLIKAGIKTDFNSMPHLAEALENLVGKSSLPTFWYNGYICRVIRGLIVVSLTQEVTKFSVRKVIRNTLRRLLENEPQLLPILEKLPLGII
jgi:hypothetical protein